MRRVLALTLASICLWLPRQGRADATPNVAILVQAEVNLTRDAADELGSQLGDALEATFDVRTIPANVIRQLAPDVSASCASDLSCSAELAEKVGAGFLLFVSAVKVGDQLRLDATWVRAGRGFSIRDGILLPARPSAEDFQRAVRSLPPPGEVSARVVQSREPPIQTSERHMTTATWIAASATLVFVATSAGFGTWALMRSDDCDGCSDDEFAQIEDDVAIGRAVADIAALGAIATGVTAVVLYWRSGSADEPALSVAPTRDGMAVQLGLRF